MNSFPEDAAVTEEDGRVVTDSTASPAPAAPGGHAAKSHDDEYLRRATELIDASQGALAEVIDDRLPPETDTAAAAAALSLSVVIPVFNEESTIREIVARVRAVRLHKEIVIVDDCSTDGTRDILRELERDEDVRVFLHGYNRGKGAALRTGFDQVKGDVVIVQDADLEYDPRDFPQLLEPIRSGQCDVVYGSRFLRDPQQDPSLLHRFGNWLLTAASNRLTGQQLTDMETCYKALRRGVLERLSLRENRFGFEPEITAKISQLGIQIREVPVSYHGRSYREGKKIGIRDAISALHCILRYSHSDE